jgi:hypothetical protein
VFYSQDDCGLAIITTAVDDLIITASSEKLLDDTKKHLSGKFNMKDLKDLYWLLNIKIKCNKENKTISLSQEAYIEKILKHFNLQDKNHIYAYQPQYETK